MSGFQTLLRPRFLTALNGLKKDKQNSNRTRLYLFGVIGLVFWVGAFLIVYRVLTYFQSVQS